MRPSTPLSASWIVVGADGTEQQQQPLPSPVRCLLILMSVRACLR